MSRAWIFCLCRNRAILSIDSQNSEQNNLSATKTISSSIVRMSDGWAANSFRTSLRSERKQDYPQTPVEDAH
jgi:hypothetical protein